MTTPNSWAMEISVLSCKVTKRCAAWPLQSLTISSEVSLSSFGVLAYTSPPS